MAYTALARRYRSQSFDDVVGQEPIAQTLKASIASDRVHHAYLFCGTRGVGKTSMARLFARALNAPDTIPGCPKPKGVDFPPLDVQQRMADAIMRGDDLNVIEIDGASNRGVEDARQLIANAGLAPSGNARFKVYIIDEVHMLTKDAFNTLLKIMEEPPSHLKFILATTEPHKVLPTIHSRCQRFDFRNIPTSLIAEHLKDVCDRERVKADAGVLFQVAAQGNGSMRDALSLLDRLMATNENPLTPDLLERMLGLPDRELVFQLLDAVATSDTAGVLARTDDLINRGIAQDQLLSTLIEHLRHLMLAAACGADSSLIEIDDASRRKLADQAARFDTATVVHAIALLETVQRNSKFSSTPRALLDAALVRLAMSERVAQIAALLAGTPASARPGLEKKKLTPPVVEIRPVTPAPPQLSAPPVRTPAPPPVAAASAAKPQAAVIPTPSLAPRAAPVDRDAAMKIELVRQVVDLFDARLVNLERAPGTPAKPVRSES